MTHGVHPGGGAVRPSRIGGFLLALLTIPAFGAMAQAPSRPNAGVHYVYLIRHGAYDRDSTTDDVTGNGLNALGHRQAHLIGARLAALPVSPATFVSSALRRARETAADMAVEMKRTPTQDSLLSECTPMSSRPDFMRNHSPEAIAECDSQLVHAWARYMTPTPEADRHDVLVCHGNVIRWFVSRAMSGDPRHWDTMDIGNGSLTILSVRSDGTTRLVMFSDVGHLPVTEQSWTGRGAGWARPVPGMR
jgi:serine/threonine-protein phosphatase PGAM5